MAQIAIPAFPPLESLDPVNGTETEAIAAAPLASLLWHAAIESTTRTCEAIATRGSGAMYT